MKFTGYFLTVLAISGAGSILNTLLWFGEEQIYDDSNFRHDFSWYFQIFLLSAVLSFVSSLVFIILIWMVENFRKKFTLAIHLFSLLVMLTIMFLMRSQFENYMLMLAFYLPGLLGYYVFVYRKSAIHSEEDLLDR
jgi:hypothetical protein